MIVPEAPCVTDAMSPLQLAYVGDSVYSLLVRTRLLGADRKLRQLHLQANGCVNASAQARALALITSMLNEEELDLVRRSRNIHARHPAPKSASSADYAASTALEAVFGYLYLQGRNERLGTLFDYIFAHHQEEHDA